MIVFGSLAHIPYYRFRQVSGLYRFKSLFVYKVSRFYHNDVKDLQPNDEKRPCIFPLQIEIQNILRLNWPCK